MTNTTTPLTREQKLEQALRDIAKLNGSLAMTYAQTIALVALASPGEPNEIKRMRAALAAGEEYVNALAAASGAMKKAKP